MQLKVNKWIKPFLRSLIYQLYLIVAILLIFGLLILFTRAPFYFYRYGAQITIFVWLLIVLFQWIKYKRRIENVRNLNRTTSVYFENTPPTSIDEAYEMQYRELEKAFQQYKEQVRFKEQEQMDYFTLWLHQIKTPISVMSLILQKEETEFKEKQQMKEELFYLNDYTHMALNYLKLDETGKELDLEEVKVNRVVTEILKKNALLFIHNDISLEYEPIEDVVLTDRKWLQVLLEQILSNSLKYTPNGNIRIYMNSKGQLIIEDTGSGIRKEDLPKIFEKGYTGLDGRLHEKSTGLGLFLSKKICERLGHKLTIESEIGVGTKVIVDFSLTPLVFFD